MISRIVFPPGRGLKIFSVFSASVCFFLLFSFATFAVSLTISTQTAELNSDQELAVDVRLEGSSIANKTYFLRAAFYPDGTSNYFGYTQNLAGEWHNQPSEPGKFLEITTSPESSWSGQLKAKLDLENSYYQGPGQYQFKVGRYTQTGSSVTQWSEPITLNVTGPPMPTPTPEPESTPKSTASTKPKATTTTTTPKPSPTPTSLAKTITQTSWEDDAQADLDTNLTATRSNQVLGLTAVTADGQDESTDAAKLSELSGPTPFHPFLFVGSGFSFVATAATLAFKRGLISKFLHQ